MFDALVCIVTFDKLLHLSSQQFHGFDKNQQNDVSFMEIDCWGNIQYKL